MDGLHTLEQLARLARREQIPVCAPDLCADVLHRIAVRTAAAPRPVIDLVSLCWAAATTTAAALALAFLSSGGEDSSLLESFFSSFDPFLQLTAAAGV